MRAVKDFQLSMKGYRKDPSVLPFSLYSSNKPSVWKHYSDLYPALAARLTKGRVKWGTHEASDVSTRLDSLAQATRSSPQGEACLTLEQIQLARDWKMIRNRVRPSWDEPDKIPPAQAVKSTKEAFELLGRGEWKEAMKTMTETSRSTNLHGIGPATASILLALRDPGVPFFGEEIIRVALPNAGMSYKYSFTEFEDFYDVMKEKEEEIGSSEMGVYEMERAVVSGERVVWLHARLRDFNFPFLSSPLLLPSSLF